MSILPKVLRLIAAVVVGAAGVESYHRAGPTPQPVGQPPPTSAAPTPTPPPHATARAPEPATPVSGIAFEGATEVSEERVARVTFKEGERVFEVAVRPGQTVKPGGLLFTLKGVHLQQLERAEAEAVDARRNRLAAAVELAAEKRRVANLLRRLQDKGAVVADDVRRAESDVAQADRAVEYHRAQVREQEQIHAAAKAVANEEYVTLPEGFPYAAGIVRRVTVTPGDMRRGSSFQGVEVVNIDELTVRVVVPPAQQAYLATVRLAESSARVVVSFAGVEYPAALAPPGIEADPATGTTPTVIVIPNAGGRRLPIGARVSVRITTD